VEDLVISPAFASDLTIFAATYCGGVFRSTDRGDLWGPANNGLTDFCIYTLAVSPDYSSDKTLFAGTNSGKVFKSVDAGGVWSDSSTGLPDKQVHALAISPDYPNDHTIFAGTLGGGVYRSNNAGGSWVEVTSGYTDLWVLSLAISPGFASDLTIFAATDGEGLLKSTDGGASWTSVNNGLPIYLSLSRVVLSPNYLSDGTLFTAFTGVYISTNRGNSWQEVGNSPWRRYVTALAAVPGNSVQVLAGTDGQSVWSYEQTAQTQKVYLPLLMNMAGK